MTNLTTVLLAVLPVLSAALGATLQHLFSRSAEVKKQAYALKQQAYVDYLRALANAAHSASDEDRAKARLLAADAKTRVAVYGDTTVINALAEFEAAGPMLDNPRSIEAFLIVAAAMRGRNDIEPQRLVRILLGPKSTSAATPPAACV